MQVQWTLKALRIQYGLSAKEVAEQLGIHHQTLLKYENDSTNISVSLLSEIAKFYRVNTDDIFLGKKSDLKQILAKLTPEG